MLFLESRIVLSYIFNLTVMQGEHRMDIITLNDVSMCFNIGEDRVDSLKEYFIKMAKKQLFYHEFWALKNVCLTIQKGEVFGLVGLNGAGKSTLLKVVAGVLKPTKGICETRGSIAPLIELGAGFDPDLTAKENVFMNGAVLGYSAAYMSEQYDEIIDFAELWDFTEVPVKNFSSGMYARLGFSIATMVKPDILIVDEILGVGDYKFQVKCHDRINQMIKSGTTILMVSHSSDIIKQLCDRAAWLEKGSVKMIGDATEVCSLYEHVE